MNQTYKANAFQQLHHQHAAFVMANAWDAGSAVILEQSGFQALGTTSAGMAFSRALPDYQGKLPFEDALSATKNIVDSVNIPVSMDSEDCYAESAEAVYQNAQKIISTGVAGFSIEDYGTNNSSTSPALYDIDYALDRVAAARAAIQDTNSSIVLTARAECYLAGHPDSFNESVKRLLRYKEAGANCLYAPGITDLKTIKDLVDAVGAPINIVMGLMGTPLTVPELSAVGVSRISIGGSLARATLGFVRQSAGEILENGSFEYANQQIPDSDLSKLFSEKL